MREVRDFFSRIWSGETMGSNKFISRANKSWNASLSFLFAIFLSNFCLRSRVIAGPGRWPPRDYLGQRFNSHLAALVHLRYSTMNSLYTSGVRQTNSLQVDIERLRNGDNSPALLGAYIQPQTYFQTQLGWLTKRILCRLKFRTNICISFCDAADNRWLRLNDETRNDQSKAGESTDVCTYEFPRSGFCTYILC